MQIWTRHYFCNIIFMFQQQIFNNVLMIVSKCHILTNFDHICRLGRDLSLHNGREWDCTHTWWDTSPWWSSWWCGTFTTTYWSWAASLSQVLQSECSVIPETWPQSCWWNHNLHHHKWVSGHWHRSCTALFEADHWQLPAYFRRTTWCFHSTLNLASLGRNQEWWNSLADYLAEDYWSWVQTRSPDRWLAESWPIGHLHQTYPDWCRAC